MQEQVVIRAEDEAALSELAAELDDDQDVDPADVDYDRSDVPGQAGALIILAILILILILIGKGIASGTGVAIGQRSARAILTKLSRWHNRHGEDAKYTIRDADGSEREITWKEIEDRLKGQAEGTD